MATMLDQFASQNSRFNTQKLPLLGDTNCVLILMFTTLLDPPLDTQKLPLLGLSLLAKEY